jgi:uncharacterized membrane protein
MPDQTDRNPAPSLVAENIEAIVQVEEEALSRRSRSDATAEAIGSFIGTASFVVLHAIVVAVWVIMNSGLIPGLAPFDPYPFTFLATLFSVEAVLLVTFVLMKQNRMSTMADRRAHLDLQVNLLTERETSKALQLLQKLCEKHGIKDALRDPETQELARTTEVEHVVDELRRRLPDD